LNIEYISSNLNLTIPMFSINKLLHVQGTYHRILSFQFGVQFTNEEKENRFPTQENEARMFS